jgi:hypothetical protein
MIERWERWERWLAGNVWSLEEIERITSYRECGIQVILIVGEREFGQIFRGFSSISVSRTKELIANWLAGCTPGIIRMERTAGVITARWFVKDILEGGIRKCHRLCGEAGIACYLKRQMMGKPWKEMDKTERRIVVIIAILIVMILIWWFPYRPN